MNRKLVIVVRRHGSQTEEILSGPEVSIPEQEKKFMPFRLVKTHPDFEFAALCWLDVERLERFGKASKPIKGKNENV